MIRLINMKTLARHSVSSQMKDLISRPVSVSYGIVESLSDKYRPSKTIASRVMAAKAVLRAMQDENADRALETILDRTEGKVVSQESTGGSTINFNFVVQGDQGVRQVGELVTGVLQHTGINRGMCQDVDAVPGSAQAGQLVGINPPSRSTPGVNPPLALPAPDPDHDEDAHNNGAD